MPQTEVRVYQDARRRSPFLKWLHEVYKLDRAAYVAVIAAIRELQAHGCELRRPLLENLGQGVWELRVKENRNHYRVLFGYIKRHVACLSHGIVKKDLQVDPGDIADAVERLKQAKSDPDRFTVSWDE